MNEQFYELVQVALGEKDDLSTHPSEEEWTHLLSVSLKQAVAGLTFCTLDKLSKKGQNIPTLLLYEWIGISENIKQQNILLNKRAFELSRLFKSEGFRSCILKGQGNALLYPNPHSRTPGDIDVWLDGSKDKIVDFVKSRYPDSKDNGYHLEYPIFKDVEVEVHYYPQFLTTRFYNKRLVDFFVKESEAQFAHEVPLPDVDGVVPVPYPYFNLILQLAHILGHFYGEGLGFRHLIDIYYVLKNRSGDQTDYEVLLSHLGLLSFARGVMWIEHNVLGLDMSYLVVKPSEKKGRLILKEIEEGGNFGYYNKKNLIRNRLVFIRAFIDTYRHFLLFSVQPSEAFQRLINKLTNAKSWKEALRLK